MPDWEYIAEKLEKGVSGFKVSASKLGAIPEIRQMAERKEFDILPVFIIQRITGEKDCKIHIRFFFTQEKMQEAFNAANIKISEATTWYIAGA